MSSPNALVGVTQRGDGSWELAALQVAALRPCKVMWFEDATAEAPVTEADGLAVGDLVNGVPVPQVVVTLGAPQAPSADDQAGTGQDAVVLQKVTGVTWVVAGVDHPSSGFAGSTKRVPFTQGTSTTVTAKAETTAYAVGGVTSWVLPFSNTTGGLTPDGTMFTSASFDEAAKTVPIGSGIYTLDAAYGGATKNCTVQTAACTITAGGAFGLGSGSVVYIPNPGNTVGLMFTVAAVGASGYAAVKPVRGAGATGHVAAVVGPATTKLEVKQPVAGTVIQSGGVATQAGDVVEVTRNGTAAALKVYRGGVQFGATQLGLTKGEHIIARACQKYGFMTTETAGSVSIGCQSGYAWRLAEGATGVDPYAPLFQNLDGTPSSSALQWSMLSKIPQERIRAHRVFATKAEFDAALLPA